MITVQSATSVERALELVNQASAFVWGAPLLILLVGTGLGRNAPILQVTCGLVWEL